MMVKINLKGGYKMVQAGERVLEITDVKVTPSGKPEKMTLSMKDVEDGATLQNNYMFTNEKSLWAMGMMLSTALGIEDGEMFDTKDASKLIGIKLLCEVTHSEYNDRTYANVRRVISRVDEQEVTSETVDEVLYGRSVLDDEEDDLA